MGNLQKGYCNVDNKLGVGVEDGQDYYELNYHLDSCQCS
jgi:hypothetical protein